MRYDDFFANIDKLIEQGQLYKKIVEDLKRRNRELEALMGKDQTIIPEEERSRFYRLELENMKKRFAELGADYEILQNDMERQKSERQREIDKIESGHAKEIENLENKMIVFAEALFRAGTFEPWMKKLSFEELAKRLENA